METDMEHSDEAGLVAPSASLMTAPVDSVADPMSLMPDQLSFDFSGSALQELEQLGVSAFDSSEIERNVLAEAIAQEQINEQQKQQQIEAALAAAETTGEKPAATAKASPTIARPRIPKKGDASRITTSSSTSSRPSATVPRKPHKEIIHPAEKPISKKYRKTHREDGSSDESDEEAEEEHKGGSEGRSSLTPSIAPGRVKELTKNFKRNEEEWNARQAKIAHGEVTPFSTIQGAEKQFTRVATSRVDAPSPSAAAKKKAAAAIASAGARPSIPKGPMSASQQIAAARIAASNAPFPLRMGAAAAASATSAGSAAKSLTPSKGLGQKEKTKNTSSNSSKKRKRASSSSSSEDDSSMSDVDDRKKPGKRSLTNKTPRSPVSSRSRSNSPPVKKERIVTHPWTCEACTYINPSDFVNRCEICQTVRKNSNNMSSSNGQVKPEPGASPSKPVYIDISSDSEEIDGKAVASRKLVKIEDDDDEEFGAEDAAAAAAEEEEEDKDADEDDDEVEEDAAVVDEVDRALKKEAEAEDEEQDSLEDEDAGYDQAETYAQRAAARGRKSKFSQDDYEDWRYDERVDAFRAYQSVLNSQASAAAAADGSANADHLDVAFDGGYILPAYLWNKLFAYQKTCIKWLWELHEQNVGGIIADEMGLGKTIQIIAFLAGLHHSAQFDTIGSGAAAPSSSTVAKFRNQGPTLIVVPATLLSQWMREFHEWYPELRIFVLHDSVGHDQKITRRDLVQKVYQTNGVLITTYQSMRTCKTLLLPRQWAYVILDEGHKIRNPDAHITLLVKQLKCIHRLILTGSPIQNRLTELWSLFDFVFPGKLGTLPVFEDEICFPILYGGYTGASSVQIALAYKCAVILRDAINPYILRRTKADVMQHLPKKTEHILFCHLTDEQHDIYARFLDSHAKDIGEILQGKLSLFHVIHLLRKIANHPDLLDLNTKEGKKKSIKATMREFNLVNRKGNSSKKKYNDDSDEENDAANMLSTRGADYGAVSRSGKMQVVEQVLKLFKEQGHRVLIFSQTRQMLDILEKFVRQAGYSYRRMDGSTSIKQRLPLMDEFNHNPSIFIMLLTTRAGGLGVNLTGANRVILYDPDWNPSTDAQARERAYRIGQQREVTVYRLITRGCIEEKVYHRQIWKQFLTDKVLKDPEQKRFFSNNDIKDLFSLAPLHSRKKAEKNQTATIFEGAGGVINKREVIAQESQRQLEEAMAQRRLAEEANASATANVKAEKEEGEIDDRMEVEEGEIIDEPPAGASAFFPDAKPTPLDNPPPLEDAQGVAPAAVAQVKTEPLAASEEPPRKKQKPNSAVKKEKTGLEDTNLDIVPYVDPLAVDQKKKLSSAAAPAPSSRDGSGAAAANGAEGSSTEQDNNRILAALFSREGIESAMDHDVILAASTSSEKTRADAHANKQAQKAMHALKASRREMRDAPINKPTWTGKHGVSGAPPGLRGEAPKPRFGTTTRKPSSNSAVGAAGASAVNTTAEGLQDARLRPAVFTNPNSNSAAAAAASSSSSSSAAKHFDSSVSGFSTTHASPASSSSASAASRPSAGGAVSSSTLLERMKARNALSQRPGSGH